jgi:hypothetical protein
MAGEIILSLILIVCVVGFCWWGNRIMDEIATLKRETMIIAKLSVVHSKKISSLEEDIRKLVEHEKHLTIEPAKPKIIAKAPAPKRVNWRQAREALENANGQMEEQ